MDERFENTPAMLVIFKLVEACTGGCQQDDVSSTRGLRRGFNSAL
jgi:hypothetical protein